MSASGLRSRLVVRRELRENEAVADRTAGFTMQFLFVVRPEPPGQYTARVMGFSEIRGVAPTEQEAVERARSALTEWLKTAQWVPVEVPAPQSWAGGNGPGGVDPNDPLEHEYLRDLERFRQEDRERTFREYDQECSDSSSTPTT